MRNQIVLDEGSFKALSSESRVSILKNLKTRRHTLSELSKTLALGTSTVKEHCDVLRKAELIEQFDEGRKWKYYALTEKGRQVIAPSLYEDLQVLITLCTTVIIFSGVLFLLLGTTGNMDSRADRTFYTLNEDEKAVGTESDLISTSTNTDTSGGLINQEVSYAPNSLDRIDNFTTQEIIPIICASTLIGIFIGWAFRKNSYSKKQIKKTA
jgi:DNA-binding transcriptional ArsR family regulator